MALNRQHYFSGIISYSDLPLNAIIVIEHCSHKKVNIKNMKLYLLNTCKLYSTLESNNFQNLQNLQYFQIRILIIKIPYSLFREQFS